jgi:hypothetical protein
VRGESTEMVGKATVGNIIDIKVVRRGEFQGTNMRAVVHLDLGLQQTSTTMRDVWLRSSSVKYNEGWYVRAGFAEVDS